ncbi:MAG: hypothetical protein K1Y36_08505 [Blastocatellia bacterium]|nr:hypothetical protein [Blastocatellia bacterium]
MNTIGEFVAAIDDSSVLLSHCLERVAVKSPLADSYFEQVAEHTDAIAYAAEQFGLKLKSHPMPIYDEMAVAMMIDLGELVRVAGWRLGEMDGDFYERLRVTLSEAPPIFRGLAARAQGFQHGIVPSQAIPTIKLLRKVMEVPSRTETALAPVDSATPPRESLPHDDPFDLLALGEDEIGSFLEGFGDTGNEVWAGEPSTGEVPTGQTEADDETVRELFSEIATAFVRPLREFVAQVRLGRGGKDWIEPCLAACKSVRTAALGIGIGNLATHMEAFETVLRKAELSYGDNPDTDEILRDEIHESYLTLENYLPKVFLIPDDFNTPESIIISSLLKQVNVGRPAIRRLFAAGVITLSAYVTARPTDMAAAAGLPLSVAERIVDRFRLYATEPRHRMDEKEAREVRVSMLKGHLDSLRSEQETFLEAASNEWIDPSKAPAKTESRRRRQEIMWEVTVLLSELGEAEVLDKLVRLPFDKRIELLEQSLGHYF